MRIFMLAAVACVAQLPAAVAEAACARQAWSEFLNDLVVAQSQFAIGNPAPMKAMWSHAPDVTLMGAWGGHERGWPLVSARLDWVAKSSREGTYAYDEISSILGADLALFVQVEHFTNKTLYDGAVRHLRVTHVMRCESNRWRVVTRHADRLAETTPPPGVAPLK